MKKPAIRAWTYVADRPWAITHSALQQILDIAARENPDWEAVAAKTGKLLESTWTVQVRDGVAIVPVMGPIFRYANLFTMFSGATSVEDFATDFQAALDNPAVKAIVLNIDSPGGEITGVNELGAMIARAAEGSKPVIAYAGGLAASGAYWLASQAQKIVADPTAMIGSIGVVATIRDSREKDAKAGITTYEIVSSQSPNKRLDPATDEGRAAMQVILDDLASEFVAAVALGRGVSDETVLNNFGKGGMMTAKRAIEAGMADELGSLEGVLAQLASPGSEAGPAIKFGGTAKSTEGGLMADEKTPAVPAAVDENAVRMAGAKAATDRIAAILECDEARDRPTQAKAIALDTELTVEAAKKLLAASPKETAPAANALQAAMSHLPNPKVGEGAGAQDEEKTLIAGVLQFATKAKGKAA